MKKIISITLLAFLSLSSITLYSQDNSQTEEYAIISVFQRGKKNFISITIGSTSTEEKEYNKEKNSKAYDIAPIIREMEKLNEKGFKLFNSNLSLAGEHGSFPFYYFVFVRQK